ncbi:MAG: hypothetical protein ACOX5P_03615, partial [Bacilli bacterium]
MVEGTDFEDLADFSGYTNETIMEDVKALVGIVKDIIAFGAVDIYKGGEINYDNEEIVRRVLANIFGLNYFEINKQAVIDFVALVLPVDIDLSLIDVNNIDFAGDGLLLGDFYEALLPILTDEEFTVKTLDLIIDFVNEFDYEPFLKDAYAYAVIDALKVLADTTLVKESLLAALDLAGQYVPEEFGFVFDANAITKAQMSADLMQVLEAASIAVELGVVRYFNETPIRLAGTKDKAVELVTKLLTLNLVKLHHRGLIIEALRMIDVELEDVDLADVVWADEVELIAKVVKEVIDIALNNNNAYLDELLDFIDEVKADYEIAITEANALSVVKVLEILTDSEIVKAVALPLIDKYVVPMVEGTDFEDLADFSGYTNETIMEDVKVFVGIVKDIIAFGAVDIYRGEVIDYANSEPVKAALAKLFSLNYLTINGQTIVDFVETMLGDLDLNYALFDIDKVDFAGDGLLLGDFYEALLPILTDKDFPLSTFDAIKAFMEDLDYEQFLKDAYAHTALDALKVLVTTSLVKELIPVAFDFARQFVPATFDFVFDLNVVTVDKVVVDLIEVLDTLHIAVDLGAVNYITESKLEVAGTEDQVAEIVKRLLSLNIVVAHYEEAIREGLWMIDADIADVDLANVVWADEVNLIAEAVKEAIKALPNNEIKYLDELFDFIDEVKADYEIAITEANGLSVANILDILKDSEIVKAVIIPLYQMAIDKFVDADAKYAGFINLAGYTAAMAVEDLGRVVNIIKYAIEFGAVDIYHGEAIDYANADPIPSIISEVLALNYLDVNRQIIVDALDDMLEVPNLNLHDIDVDLIDFAGDAVHIADAYRALVPVLMSSANPYKTLDDILAGKGIVYEDFLIVSLVKNIIDALEHLTKTTIVKEAMPAVLAFGENTVDEEYAFLLEHRNLTKEAMLEDVDTAIALARLAVDMGVVGYLKDEGLYLAQPELIKQAIDLVFDLNILDLSVKGDQVIDLLADLIGMEKDGIDYGMVDWANEQAMLKAIVDIVSPVLINNDIAYLDQLTDFVTHQDYLDPIYVDDDNANAVIDIVEQLLKSTIIKGAFFNIYDFATSGLELEGVWADVISLDHYQGHGDPALDLIYEDLESIVDIARLAVEFGATRVYNYHRIQYSSKVNEIKAIIEKVFALNFVDVKRSLIPQILESELNVNTYRFNVDNIDFAAEGAIFAQVYEELIPILIDADFIVKDRYDIEDIVNGTKPIYTESFYRDDYAQTAINALEVLATSELVKEALPTVLYNVRDFAPDDFRHILDVDRFTKEQLVEDFNALIEIARDAVALGLIRYLNTDDFDLATKDADGNYYLISIVDKAYELNLVQANYAELVQLGLDNVIERDTYSLDGVDWQAEKAVILNLVNWALDTLVTIDDSTLKEVLAIVDNYEEYITEANAYHVYDGLAIAKDSQIVLEVLIPIYQAKVLTALPADAQSYFGLDTYTKADLASDLPVIVEIVKHALDAGMFEIYADKKYSFLPESVPYVKQIVTKLFGLIIVDKNLANVRDYLVGAIDLPELANLEVERLDLASDAVVIAGIVEKLQAIYQATNKFVLTLPMMADTTLFENLFVVYETMLSTTIVEVALPWAYESFVSGSQIGSSKFLETINTYDADQLLALADDLGRVFEALINMDVFSNNGIDFTNTDNLKTVVDVVNEHVPFSAQFKDYLNRLVSLSHILGVVPVTYTDSTLIDEAYIVRDVMQAVQRIGNSISSRIQSKDYSFISEAAFQDDVILIVDRLGDSKVYERAIPVIINAVVRMTLPVRYRSTNGIADFYLLEDKDGNTLTLKDLIVDLDKIFSVADEIVALDAFDGQPDLAQLAAVRTIISTLKTLSFFEGREEVYVQIMLDATLKINPSDIDLSGVNWADEFTLLDNFLRVLDEEDALDGIDLTNSESLKNDDLIKSIALAGQELIPSNLIVAVLPELVDALLPKLLDNSEGLVDFSGLTDEQIRSDFEQILAVLDVVADMGIVTGNRNFQIVQIIEVLKLVFGYSTTHVGLYSVNGHEEAFFDLMKDNNLIPSIAGAEFNFDAVTDWAAEVNAFIEVLNALDAFTDPDLGLETDYATALQNTTDLASLEALLVAVNKSVSFREALYKIIDDALDSQGGSGDFDINTYISDWFKDQEEGMLNVAEWEEEVRYLARLLVTMNKLDLTNLDFATVAIGQDFVGHAAKVTTQEFEDELNADHVGLKQLLELINYSKTFRMEGLVETLESFFTSGDNKITEKELGTVENEGFATIEEAWDAEIANIMALFQIAQDNGLLEGNMADKIKDLNWTVVRDMLEKLNNSVVIRVALPDLINDALSNAGMSEWASTWLTDQAGVDGTVLSKEDWAGEITKLAMLIQVAKELALDENEIELKSIELGDTFPLHVNHEDYDPTAPGAAGLKQLLQLMNYSKVFSIGSVTAEGYTGIYDILDEFFFGGDDPIIETTKPLGVVADNETAWDAEIDVLINLLATVKSLDLMEGDMADKVLDLDWTEIEDVLSKMNESTIIRVVLPDLINNALVTAGMDEWASEWLTDQTGDNPALAKDVWADEITLLAKLIKVANKLGLTEGGDIELDTIELGDTLAKNAGTDPTYDPENETAGLKQLLQIMNYSKVFTLGAADSGYTGIYQVLDDFFFGGDDPIIETTKPLGVVADNETAWDAEIDVLIDLLVTVKANGLMEGDMADKVLDLDWTEIEDVLSKMNESTIIRVVLPDLINNALVTAGMDEWASEWLRDQTGANPTKEKAEWADEITLLAKLIHVANALGLNGADMELGTIELGIGEILHAGLDEEYDPKVDEVGLKQLLQIMNYSKVFSIGSADSGYTGIYQVLYDFFFGGDEPIIKATKPLGVVVVDGFASLEQAWDAEIDALVALVKEVQDNRLTEGDMADALTDLAWTATAGVLDALNGSTIVR